MLKPDFPKKGKEEVERKGRNEKKRKKKNNKKKEKEGFSIEDRKEVKMEKIGGKQSNSRSEENRVIFGKISDCRQRKAHFWCLFLSNCHSKSFSTGDIPPHMNKEEKTETPSFLSKKPYPRENTIGP